MKISDKLLKKYATVSPMLPPPDGGFEDEMVIPTAKVPEIKPLSEEEMQDWERWLDLEKTKKKTDLGKEEKAEKEEGTRPAIPKHKKSNLSVDTLLKMCSEYHDLCHKF